ncbi:killer cell lectin-like receptor subfamily I member 1 isoform X3 [Equus przewalskii]|uniref:Killer cell lectin-like receptor subfamily I member 1 isoform X3 n=1 Tax=Equus przewalskii TaxID=9798 RepID=A0ABM4PDB6_EQUPR
MQPSEMSKERVTYTELKLPYSKKQKNKRHPTPKKREFPWRGVAIILGIICFFLLLAITGLGYMCKGYDPCQEKWFCCGNNCYYFSKEEKTWAESKMSYQDLCSSRTKVYDKQDQEFSADYT